MEFCVSCVPSSIICAIFTSDGVSVTYMRRLLTPLRELENAIRTKETYVEEVRNTMKSIYA